LLSERPVSFVFCIKIQTAVAHEPLLVFTSNKMVLVKMLKAPNLLGRWIFVETDRTNDEIQFKVGQITLD